MNTDPIIFSTFTALGFFLTALGGLGLWYFSRAARAEMELQAASANAKCASLKKANEDLREQLKVSERGREPVEAIFELVDHDHGPRDIALPRPAPAAVKIPASSWAGAAVLDEMIESSMHPEPEAKGELGGTQRRAMVSVLRKHAGRAIAIRSVEGDLAALEFARNLKAVFEEAGWIVSGVERAPYANPPAGLFITSGTLAPPEETIIPHEALTAAGCLVSRCADSNLKSEKAVLLVGAAPRLAAA